VGKLLVVAGLGLAGIGALLMLGFPLGRLPGDLVYRRGSVSVYVPVATSILLSLVFTIVLALWRR